MDSPHSCSDHATNRPILSGLAASLTVIVQVPTGFSSLMISTPSKTTNIPMLDTHKLPPSKSSGSLIEPPLSSQNTELSTRTEELNFDITSSLMIDPDSRSDMFQRLQIGFIQHLLRDFVGGLDPLGCDVSTCTSHNRIWVLLLAIAVVVLSLDSFIWVLNGWSLKSRDLIGREEYCGRIKPCLWLDQLEGPCQFDKSTSINLAVAICLSVMKKRAGSHLHL